MPEAVYVMPNSMVDRRPFNLAEGYPDRYTLCRLTLDPVSAAASMSRDELKAVASGALRTLFKTDDDMCPIPVMMLLAHVVALGTKGMDFSVDAELLKQPRFRLTDVRLFASILRDFAQYWEYGTMILSKHSDESLVILGVQLHNVHHSLKKRKRTGVTDAESSKDMESVEPSLAHDHLDTSPQPSIFETLSADLQVVYATCHKGTAKGRILAEQASRNLFPVFSSEVDIRSRIARMNRLMKFALTQRNRHA